MQYSTGKLQLTVTEDIPSCVARLS